MISFLSFSLVSVAVVLAIPVTVFLIEIVASSVLPQRNWVMPPSRDRRLRCAVLVPAHNESTGLLPTLADISAQLRAADRLLVIADNCTDDTASIAAMAGAVVVIRNEPGRKGKGYALACGLGHLREDPPDIVIVVDADCRVADGAIDRLIAACEVTQRPVQGLFQMIAPDELSDQFPSRRICLACEKLVAPARSPDSWVAVSADGFRYGFSLERDPIGASGKRVDRRRFEARTRPSPNRESSRILFIPHRDQRLAIFYQRRPDSAAALGGRSHRYDLNCGSAIDVSVHNAGKFKSSCACARPGGSTPDVTRSPDGRHADRGQCRDAARAFSKLRC